MRHEQPVANHTDDIARAKVLRVIDERISNVVAMQHAPESVPTLISASAPNPTL
jgi:hypothetical protein